MTTTTVKERPILFSAPMVNAILAGRKTVTRRIVKPQPEFVEIGDASYWSYRKGKRIGWNTCHEKWFQKHMLTVCPFGKPGDHLWVREKWRLGSPFEETKLREFHDPEEVLFDHVHYFADDYDADLAGQYRPSIHMPHWASRIALEVTDVRVERLQNISASDIRAEGFDCPEHDFPGGMCVSECRSLLLAFAQLWEKLNGTGSWDANPWVWRVEFKRLP